MNKTFYSTLNETLYSGTLHNGMTVYIVPKPSYHKTYVTLSTPFGSNVTSIMRDNKIQPLPPGIAHFLEHKLFDHPDMDVSSRFSMQSAQVNAYTMNQRTTYLFSCTNQLYDNMATLFDFVFDPHFTEEGIADEIGVIGQEISMYHDDPNVAIYMGLLQNMYHVHPVRNDILGTKESIATITKDLLEQVHDSCYHPQHMVLFITGNVNHEEMWTWLSQHSPTNSPTKHVPIPAPNEPSSIVTKHGEKQMDILLPNALLGIKLPMHNIPHTSIMKWELVFSMFTDMVMGRSTSTYESLLHDGLINDTFGMDITLEEDFGFVMFGSQTSRPQELFDRLIEIIMNASIQTMDVTHFERTKKQVIGHFIQSLNSLEYIANQFTKYHFMNANLFDVLDIMQSISMDDIQQLLTLIQHKSNVSTYVITPKKKENQ